MKNAVTIPSAEPFFYCGGEIGCVLVHGFTGTPKEVRNMGEFLNQNGITIAGVRLAGHATTPVDLIRTRWQDWLASVEDGANLLRDACRYIFAAGLSLGGILCLVAAQRLQLDGVIAMSTPYNLPDDWRLKIAKPLSFIVPWIDKGQNETKDKKSAKLHVDYPKYPTRSIAEVYELTKIFHGSLPSINLPVLLINSKSDQTVPFWHADRIENLLDTKDVKKVLINDSGHVITEDIERDIVFNAALDFIKEISGKAR